MGDFATLKEWHTYPHNLRPQGCNAYGYDFDAYAEQLDEDSERLFVNGSRVCVKIIEFAAQHCKETVVYTTEDLRPFFQRPKKDVTRIILIPQESSWGKLNITKECMLLLLSALQVFPAIIDVLRAFGQRTAVKDESYGGFYAQDSTDPSCQEYAYTIKYSEKHGRDGPLDPWSLRQMGIYHQCLDNNDSNTFIVLHPSRPFLKRLKRVVSCKSFVTPESVQMMALSAAMDNWRWYLSAVTTHQSGDVHADITFEDTQDIQVLQDKLSRSLLHLTTSHTIIERIQTISESWKSDKSLPHRRFLETLALTALMELNRVRSILKRAEATQALAQSLLDFTCLESLRSNSRTMTELTKLSQEEADVLLELSRKTSRDNDILRILALFGLIYLPLTLGSSIMGMEYIKLEHHGKRLALVIESEMYIFLVLVVIMLIATLVSYFAWTRYQRTQRKEAMSQQCRTKHFGW